MLNIKPSNSAGKIKMLINIFSVALTFLSISWFLFFSPLHFWALQFEEISDDQTCLQAAGKAAFLC